MSSGSTINALWKVSLLIIKPLLPRTLFRAPVLLRLSLNHRVSSPTKAQIGAIIGEDGITTTVEARITIGAEVQIRPAGICSKISSQLQTAARRLKIAAAQLLILMLFVNCALTQVILLPSVPVTSLPWRRVPLLLLRALATVNAGELNEAVWYPDSVASSHMTPMEGHHHEEDSSSGFQ